MLYYQFLWALAYSTVSHAYMGSCNSPFLLPLLTLYKTLLYIDTTYFKIGAYTVKTASKFEFRRSNLPRHDQTTSRSPFRLRKANYPPYVLGATPPIHCTENY